MGEMVVRNVMTKRVRMAALVPLPLNFLFHSGTNSPLAEVRDVISAFEIRLSDFG